MGDKIDRKKRELAAEILVYERAYRTRTAIIIRYEKDIKSVNRYITDAAKNICRMETELEYLR